MKKKVLLVDDEAHVYRRLLPRLMAEYEMLLEDDSTVALGVAQEFSPDVFLLDLIMPGVDGLDLAAQIGMHEIFRKTPIIFISACINASDDGEPVEFQSYPAFSKPFSIPALKRCIEFQLSIDRGM